MCTAQNANVRNEFLLLLTVSATEVKWLKGSFHIAQNIAVDQAYFANSECDVRPSLASGPNWHFHLSKRHEHKNEYIQL